MTGCCFAVNEFPTDLLHLLLGCMTGRCVAIVFNTNHDYDSSCATWGGKQHITSAAECQQAATLAGKSWGGTKTAPRRAHRSRTTRLIDGCACVPHRCCRRLEGLRTPLLPRAQVLAARAAELAAPPPQVGALARRVGLGVSAMSRSSAQLASWA